MIRNPNEVLLPDELEKYRDDLEALYTCLLANHAANPEHPTALDKMFAWGAAKQCFLVMRIGFTAKDILEQVTNKSHREGKLNQWQLTHERSREMKAAIDGVWALKELHEGLVGHGVSASNSPDLTVVKGGRG